jgi:hypothetical protein
MLKQAFSENFSTRPNQLWLVRTVLLVSLLFRLCALNSFFQQGARSGNFIGQYSVVFVCILVMLGLFGLLVLFGLVTSFLNLFSKFENGFLQAMNWLKKQPLIAWLGFSLAGCVFPWLIFGPYRDNLYDLFPRLLVLWVCIQMGGVFLVAARPGLGFFSAMLSTGVVYAGIFQTLSFVPTISDYPFSMGWSEGSRYYYGSLFLSRTVYGHWIPLPTLDPSRYILQAFPFLFPTLGILYSRLWQSLLWVGLTGLTGWALARRLHLRNHWLTFLAAGWVYLFLFQAPVYFHLVIIAAFTLGGVDTRRFWRSALVVAVASVWAGISRVNWYPVPALLAACLYFLENPQQKQALWDYLKRPFGWLLIGLPVAFIYQLIYVAVSGYPAQMFSSSFTSKLIWSRLLPNATFPEGILTLSLVLFAPYLAWLARAWQSKIILVSRLRQVSFAVILLVFFAGGVLVSLKVGGGNNLHNLDAFLVFMAVILVYSIFGRVSFEPEIANQSPKPVWWLLAILVSIPVLMTVKSGGLSGYPGTQVNQMNLNKIQVLIDQAGPDANILFMNDRQLVSFHSVKVTKLEPEYEKVTLIEMVMSNNRPYMDRFYQDLHNHRFALIITIPMNSKLQDPSFAFAEENNEWVSQVEIPVKTDYHRIASFPENSLEVYAPNP